MINRVILVFVVAIGLIVSCKKKDEKEIKNIESQITAGTWVISYFNDSGTDETHHFNGFKFSFGDDGDLSASNGTLTYNGTWKITDSNSNDDNPDDLDFNIYFNLNNEFEDLNDDWDIKSHTDTKLELIDVSGGNGGTDLLTFSKL